MVVIKVTPKLLHQLLGEMGWYWAAGIYRSPVRVLWNSIRYHRETGE